MTRTEFWILNFVSLALVAMIGFEMYSSDQLDRAQSLARQAQLPVLQAEQAQPTVRLMVERTAQGAARDPALRELLDKYGIKVTFRPPAGGNAPATASAP